MKNNNPRRAAELLEELRITNPSNPKILAQLITVYSQIDPKKAKELVHDTFRFDIQNKILFLFFHLFVELCNIFRH